MAEQIQIPLTEEVCLETGRMSRLNIDNLTGVAPMEPALPAIGLPETDLLSSESFGDHLDRARGSTAKRSAPARDEIDSERPAADDHSTPPRDSAKVRDSARKSDSDAAADRPEASDTAADAAKSDAQPDAESEDNAEQENEANGGMITQQTQVVTDTQGEEIGNPDNQLTSGLPANVDASEQEVPSDCAAEQDQLQVVPADRQKGLADSGIEEPATTLTMADEMSGEPAQTAGEPGDSPPAVQPDQTTYQDPAEQSEAAASTPTASPTQQNLDADVSRQEQRRSAQKRAPTGMVDQIAPGQAKGTATAAVPDDAELTSLSIDGSASADGDTSDSSRPTTGTSQGGTAENAAGGTPSSTAGQDVSGARASAAQGQPGSEPVDRVQFVQRVARAFRAAGERGGSVRMRLHPPELGSLRLEISMRKGTMTARLETDTATARNMLLDNLPALRDRLAQQNIRVERFDVDLADRQPGGSSEGPASQSQSQDLPDHQEAESGRSEQTKTEVPSEPETVTRPAEGSHLNVVV